MDSQPHLDLADRDDGSSPRSAVWVVDENGRTAQMLAALLQMDGYAASPCAGPRIMEKLLEAPRPAAVVMSVSMGRGDAIRGVRQIRERHPGLPMVIITENPELMQRLGPQAEPCPVLLTKPVDYAALLVALLAILA